MTYTNYNHYSLGQIKHIIPDKNGINKLRNDYPKSHFLDQLYDPAIIGISNSGAIIYNHFDLLFMMMDRRQDEFLGEDYEKQKAEFTQEFQDFYDMVDDQLCGLKNEFESLQGNSTTTIYPLILPAVRLTTADGTITKIFNHKSKQYENSKKKTKKN